MLIYLNRTGFNGLFRLVFALAARGCHVLASNSTADEIAALYDRSVLRVPARRAINRDASRRGLVEEFLITNIEGRPS